MTIYTFLILIISNIIVLCYAHFFYYKETLDFLKEDKEWYRKAWHDAETRATEYFSLLLEKHTQDNYEHNEDQEV